MRVPEETESGDVRDRVRLGSAQHVGGVLVQCSHPADRTRQLHVAGEPFLVAGHDQSRSERLRQEERVARLCAVLRPDPVGMHGADDRKAVLRLCVANRVPACEQTARRAHLLIGRSEDRAEHLHRQLLREGGDREREQRHTAHREHVVERVRRSDRAVVARIVDHRREEVEREDQGALVVEPVNSRIVRGREPDEQILRFDRDEAREQFLEARSRVLRGAAATRGEICELHASGLGVQGESS